MLHADMKDPRERPLAGILGDPFSLPLRSFPLPPDFTPLFGGLYEGLMGNVLAKERKLRGPLIEQANKSVQVDYYADNGLFGAARRRFNTEGRVLSSRFYLVTQPWHISRQDNLGRFRELGTQNDRMSGQTEEAMLRKRTFGLWLFPCGLTDLLAPLTNLIDIDLGSAGETFDASLCFVKSLTADNNPLQVLDYLSFLEGVGIDLTFPEWPAVRPAAYPGSIEMTGDRLTGTERNFVDYLEEQKAFIDREPKPEKPARQAGG